jgi:hypothetical protein
MWLAIREDGDIVPDEMALNFCEGATSIVDQLVKSGLWVRVRKGYRFRGFAEIISDAYKKRSGDARRAQRYRVTKRAGNRSGASRERHATVTRDDPVMRRTTSTSTNTLTQSLTTFETSSARAGELGDAKTPVGAYVDACRELGLRDPDDRTKGQVGKVAKGLIAEGKRPEDVLVAVKELARRNETPARLRWIVGDVERVRAGVPMGRARPLAENPVEQRIQEFNIFSEAEKRGEGE